MLPSPSRPTAALRYTFLATVTFAVTGCGQQEPAAVVARGTNVDGRGSAAIKYRSGVRVMEEAAGRKALRGVSTSGAALVLDPDDPTARSLKAGDVLVIKGLIARVVLAAEREPEGILVLTQQATLGEVIEQGTIHIQAPIRFGSPEARLDAAEPPRLVTYLYDALATPAEAQSIEQIRRQKAEAAGNKAALDKVKGGVVDAITKDWKTTFSADPAPGRLNLHLTMTKNVGGFLGLVTAEGYLADFDFDSDIDVAQSTTQRLEAGLKKVNGTMNVNWSIAKDSAGGLTEQARMKLPGAITIPLAEFLGGLPLFLEVGAAVIVNPVITGGKEYSRGAFRVNYDGYQHFSVKQGNIDADGNVTGDIKILERQGISALAPMGMAVAFAAPRIELSFGLKKLFKMDDIKTAAERVDMIAEQLAKRVLSPQQYQQYQDGPLGRFSFKGATDTALGSDAAAYFEFVTTSGTSYSGMSAITPCARTDITLRAKVGASAEAFGTSAGKTEKELFKKAFTRIDPTDVPLCENVAGAT